jgi:hypothetical protein
MKIIRSILLVAGLMAGPAIAEELELAPVPASLAPAQKPALEARREEILVQWGEFVARRKAFYTEFGRTIPTDSPRAPEAAKRKQVLQVEGEAIAERAGIYEADLITALRERLASIQQQINESRKQALQSGFAGQAQEFERIGQVSAEAVQRMKSQLIARLQDLLLQKAQSAAQDQVLERLKTLTPAQVDRFEAFTLKSETPCPAIVSVLRRITARDNPAHLAADAKDLLEGISQAHEVFEFADKASVQTIEARQETALMLLSFVLKHPALDELKTVGHAGFNVGEAWFYYFNLNTEDESLRQITDKQLQEQKIFTRRLEELFTAKHAIVADLQRLEAQ